MQSDFIDNFHNIQKVTNSNIGIIFQPVVARMPTPIRVYDDPFFPFAKAVISTTRDIVCAYMFDLAAYLSIGAAGAIALERSIAYVGKNNIRILHGPFSGVDYSRLMEENAFDVDALTLADIDDLESYRYRSDRTAFVVRETRSTNETPECDVFIRSENVLRVNTGAGNYREIWLADPELLFQSSQEDFADTIRQQLIAFQHRVNKQHE